MTDQLSADAQMLMAYIPAGGEAHAALGRLYTAAAGVTRTPQPIRATSIDHCPLCDALGGYVANDDGTLTFVPKPAGLDVERLTRALHKEMDGTEWAGNPCGHTLMARRIAREYGVPQPAPDGFDWKAEYDACVERANRLWEAARDHGLCSCADFGGPRPLGNGQFYHYVGCDDDPALRAALGDKA